VRPAPELPDAVCDGAVPVAVPELDEACEADEARDADCDEADDETDEADDEAADEMDETTLETELEAAEPVLQGKGKKSQLGAQIPDEDEGAREREGRTTTR